MEEIDLVLSDFVSVQDLHESLFNLWVHGDADLTESPNQLSLIDLDRAVDLLPSEVQVEEL